MQMMIDVAWIEVTLNPPIVNGKTQGQNTVLLKFLAKFLKDTDRMNYVFQGVVGNRDIDATIRNLLQRLVTLNAVLDGFRPGNRIHFHSKSAGTLEAAQNVAAATAEIQHDIAAPDITPKLPCFNSPGDVSIPILPLEVSRSERSPVVLRRSNCSDRRIHILHTRLSEKAQASTSTKPTPIGEDAPARILSSTRPRRIIGNSPSNANPGRDRSLIARCHTHLSKRTTRTNPNSKPTSPHS